ncbi:MAG: hypothetical protein KBD37_07860, partial [Burkholderiales bacterium]|nr:hypothetical protein [Burkholderiales bacterium]
DNNKLQATVNNALQVLKYLHHILNTESSLFIYLYNKLLNTCANNLTTQDIAKSKFKEYPLIDSDVLKKNENELPDLLYTSSPPDRIKNETNKIELLLKNSTTQSKIIDLNKFVVDYTRENIGVNQQFLLKIIVNYIINKKLSINFKECNFTSSEAQLLIRAYIDNLGTIWSHYDNDYLTDTFKARARALQIIDQLRQTRSIINEIIGVSMDITPHDIMLYKKMICDALIMLLKPILITAQANTMLEVDWLQQTFSYSVYFMILVELQLNYEPNRILKLIPADIVRIFSNGKKYYDIRLDERENYNILENSALYHNALNRMAEIIKGAIDQIKLVREILQTPDDQFKQYENPPTAINPIVVTLTRFSNLLRNFLYIPGDTPTDNRRNPHMFRVITLYEQLEERIQNLEQQLEHRQQLEYKLNRRLVLEDKIRNLNLIDPVRRSEMQKRKLEELKRELADLPVPEVLEDEIRNLPLQQDLEQQRQIAIVTQQKQNLYDVIMQYCSGTNLPPNRSYAQVITQLRKIFLNIEANNFNNNQLISETLKEACRNLLRNLRDNPQVEVDTLNSLQYLEEHFLAAYKYCKQLHYQRGVVLALLKQNPNLIETEVKCSYLLAFFTKYIQEKEEHRVIAKEFAQNFFTGDSRGIGSSNTKLSEIIDAANVIYEASR